MRLPPFGHLLQEYEDELSWRPDFIFHINNLGSRAEVLQWYLDLNAGGTPHTEQEITRVRNLLTLELAK